MPTTPHVDIEDMDDIEKDPDWKRTPLAKRVRKMRPTGSNNCLEFQLSAYVLILNSISVEESEAIRPIKRTSEGGCTCKTNCSRRTCGCKKNEKTCGISCKCLAENCANRDSSVSSILLLQNYFFNRIFICFRRDRFKMTRQKRRKSKFFVLFTDLIEFFFQLLIICIGILNIVSTKVLMWIKQN